MDLAGLHRSSHELVAYFFSLFFLVSIGQWRGWQPGWWVVRRKGGAASGWCARVAEQGRDVRQQMTSADDVIPTPSPPAPWRNAAAYRFFSKPSTARKTSGLRFFCWPSSKNSRESALSGEIGGFEASSSAWARAEPSSNAVGIVIRVQVAALALLILRWVARVCFRVACSLPSCRTLPFYVIWPREVTETSRLLCCSSSSSSSSCSLQHSLGRALPWSRPNRPFSRVKSSPII